MVTFKQSESIMIPNVYFQKQHFTTWFLSCFPVVCIFFFKWNFFSKSYYLSQYFRISIFLIDWYSGHKKECLNVLVLARFGTKRDVSLTTLHKAKIDFLSGQFSKVASWYYPSPPYSANSPGSILRFLGMWDRVIYS